VLDEKRTTIEHSEAARDAYIVETSDARRIRVELGEGFVREAKLVPVVMHQTLDDAPIVAPVLGDVGHH
jgi:hypothetical protein